MTANNSCYYDAAIACSPLYTIKKNAWNFFNLNLYVSYIFKIYFAEPTWTQFWFPFLMAFLKFFKEFISFKCDGIVSSILGPRCVRLSKPWFSVFTCGIINCDLLLRLYCSACLKRKRSFKISTTTTTNNKSFHIKIIWMFLQLPLC